MPVPNYQGAVASDGEFQLQTLSGEKIFGQEAAVQNIRTRFTVAQINAGATLLAAIPGFKYRMVDATLVAVGGAAATATAVVVNAVQSASTVALVSAAVAALTQSAVVKPNSSNVTVLADGASFVANDANTAITVGKTGGTLATATHIDVILSYVVEAA
jgi:hypothetical protein